MSLKKIAITCLMASGITFLASGAAAEDRVVFEGDRISGGIYLGMSRVDVINVSESNNCITRNACTFRLPTVDTRTLVELTFNSNQVDSITLLTGGFTTTQGATPNMNPFDVAELYNTNVTRMFRFGQPFLNIVNVPELGYQFQSEERCFRGQCVFVGQHTIFSPDSLLEQQSSSLPSGNFSPIGNDNNFLITPAN